MVDAARQNREQMKEVCSNACWEEPKRLVCLQESGGSLLQGPLAHAGLLGTRIIEGTNSLMTRSLQVMKTSKEFDLCL